MPNTETETVTETEDLDSQLSSGTTTKQTGRNTLSVRNTFSNLVKRAQRALSFNSGSNKATIYSAPAETMLEGHHGRRVSAPARLENIDKSTEARLLNNYQIPNQKTQVLNGQPNERQDFIAQYGNECLKSILKGEEPDKNIVQCFINRCLFHSDVTHLDLSKLNLDGIKPSKLQAIEQNINAFLKEIVSYGLHITKVSLPPQLTLSDEVKEQLEQHRGLEAAFYYEALIHSKRQQVFTKMPQRSVDEFIYEKMTTALENSPYSKSPAWIQDLNPLFNRKLYKGDTETYDAFYKYVNAFLRPIEETLRLKELTVFRVQSLELTGKEGAQDHLLKRGNEYLSKLLEQEFIPAKDKDKQIFLLRLMNTFNISGLNLNQVQKPGDMKDEEFSKCINHFVETVLKYNPQIKEVTLPANVLLEDSVKEHLHVNQMLAEAKMNYMYIDAFTEAEKRVRLEFIVNTCEALQVKWAYSDPNWREAFKPESPEKTLKPLHLQTLNAQEEMLDKIKDMHRKCLSALDMSSNSRETISPSPMSVD